MTRAEPVDLKMLAKAPLYSPKKPSFATILLTASIVDACTSSPLIIIRLLTVSHGYVRYDAHTVTPSASKNEATNGRRRALKFDSVFYD